MLIEIVFKLTPESKQEMIGNFPTQYKKFRSYVEDLVAKGTFPKDVPVRWLLVTGRWT